MDRFPVVESGKAAIDELSQDAYDLDEVPTKLTELIILSVNKSKITPENITYLKNILRAHPGELPVHFKVNVNGEDEVNMVSNKIKISVNAALISELEKILTIDNIKVKVKTN